MQHEVCQFFALHLCSIDKIVLAYALSFVFYYPFPYPTRFQFVLKGFDFMNPQAIATTPEPTVAVDLPDWAAHGDRPHIPNAETLAAMKEADEYFKQLEEGIIKPRFASFEEFLISLFDFEDEEQTC